MVLSQDALGIFAFHLTEAQMGAIVAEFYPNPYYFGLGLVHYVDTASSGLFNQVQINHGLLWQRNAISADNTRLDGQ